MPYTALCTSSHAVLQSNRLVDLDGLSALECLEELYASHNAILAIQGLDHCVRQWGMQDRSPLTA